MFKVMDTEDFLRGTANPSSDAEVVIGTYGGRGFEHCFRGYEYVSGSEEPLPNSITRNTYNQVPKTATFASVIAHGFNLPTF